MIRTDAYKVVGGYTTDRRLLRLEDYNLWMKMLHKGYRGYILDEPLYMMRDDRNATSRRNMRGRINGIYAHYLVHKTLHLPWYKFIIYSIMNIAKGIMPTKLYDYFHKKRLRG